MASSSAQALGALLLASAGFVLGLALDFYRVLRRLSNPGRLMTIACDLLFWLVYTVWIFILLLRISGGEVRYHVFLSIGTGTVLYFWLFSQRLSKAWYTLLYQLMRSIAMLTDAISRLIDLVLLVILWPYRIILRYLLTPLWHLITILLTPVFKLANWVRRQLHRFWDLITRPWRRWWKRLRQALADWVNPPTKES